MVQDLIRYDILTQEALRGVVRTVISEIATTGLPGEHHLYITIDMETSGVELSDRLRAQHTGEMTIVLQHQFWDLEVHEDRFEVGLAFNGVPEKLVVPFESIKGFYDPSVQFGLQFEMPRDDMEQTAKSSSPRQANDTAPVMPDTREALQQPARDKTENASKDTPESARDDGKDAGEPASGENVISIDTFRQK